MLLASYLKSIKLLSMTFIGSLFFGASAYYIFDLIAPVKVLQTINITDATSNRVPPLVEVNYFNNDRWLLVALDKIIEVRPVFTLPVLKVMREKTKPNIIKTSVIKPKVVVKHTVAKKIKHHPKSSQVLLETEKLATRKNRVKRVKHSNKQHRPVVISKKKKVKVKAHPSSSLEQSLGINLVQ